MTSRNERMQHAYDAIQAQDEFDSKQPVVSQAGLYEKFEVERTDGRDQPGGDKDNATYFVLDIANDQYARDALATYARNCRYAHPQLSKDLYQLLAEYDD